MTALHDSYSPAAALYQAKKAVTKPRPPPILVTMLPAARWARWAEERKKKVRTRTKNMDDRVTVVRRVAIQSMKVKTPHEKRKMPRALSSVWSGADA